MSVSVCINKYKFYIDNNNNEKYFELNDSKSLKNNINNINNNNNKISEEFDDESFQFNLINENINFNDYNLIDLKCSKIFENLTKNNLIKIIFDDINNLENNNNNLENNNNNLENNNNNNFKFMLINVYDIIPNIINDNEIKNNNENINIIFNSNFYFLKKDLNENINLIYKLLDIKNTNELEIYENNLYNFYYKFLYIKNEDTSIDNILTENYIKIPLNQNEKLYQKISTNYFINNNMNKILYDLIYKHNKSITKKNIMIYEIKNILKQKNNLIENYNYNKTIDEYFNNIFCNFYENLNKIKNKINVDLLENEIKNFGLNKSFLLFCVPFIENEVIKNLIIIYIFVKIIRKLIFYNFGIDFYMRIGIFDRSKKSNDLYQNDSNKRNNIIEIQKMRIFNIIKSIFENKNIYLIQFFNEYISFFIYIQYLKWNKIDNDFEIQFFEKYDDFKYENLLNLFIFTSINNPSLFLNVFEKKLNIKINKDIKYNSKENLKDFLNNLKKDDIIINGPKIMYNKKNVNYSNYIINSIKNYENDYLDKNKRIETKKSFKNVFNKDESLKTNENINHSNKNSLNNSEIEKSDIIENNDEININE